MKDETKQKLTTHQIVEKIIGSIDPVGETHTDNTRFESLRAMSELMYAIASEINYVAKHNKDRHEDSMKRAGKYADKAMKGLVYEFDLNSKKGIEMDLAKEIFDAACAMNNALLPETPTLCEDCGGHGFTQETCAGGSKIDHPCVKCNNKATGETK